MRKISLLLISLFSWSCVTSPEPITKPEEYAQKIDAHSAGEIQYEGAYSNFNFRATVINTTVQQILVDKKAEMYLWDEGKKSVELSKLQADNGKVTKVFLSFFTPNRMDDNMHSKNSIWSIYLETSQGRYEGTVIKNRESRTELYSLFPYHTRYTTGYNVSFPVPVTSIENEITTLTIAGPLGVQKVNFPAK